LSRRFALVTPLAWQLALTLPLGAQIPTKYTNLKVLPADIERPALVFTMRNIAGSLGVRCDHCHVGGDPETLRGVDFASDSLPSKRTARRMLEMVRAINQDYVAAIAPDSTRRIEVTCFTCHRGVQRPEPLERILIRLATTEGLPAAMTEYRKLRGTYYGRAAYDFGEGILPWAAELLLATRPDLSLELLRSNLEFFPSSAPTYSLMGRISLQRGDTAQAIAHFTRALELLPGDRFLTQALERLRKR
jgi:tetratricopeptide (TPR) repeat protein